jgi:hypothetical protein
MKRIACQFTYPTALVVSVVLFAFMVLASPSPSRAASPDPGMATAGKVSEVDRVEARIKELQTKLEITPAQEELWNNVTRVMRDNAKTMDALIKARSEGASTMPAIDSLKSYGEIVEAHADNIRKFTQAFEPLYTSMSDAQKKNADKLFRYHGRTKSKAKAKGK